MTTLPDHLERYLGTIQHGWTRSPAQAPPPFQTLECKGGAIADVTAFVTLGLSRIPLTSPVSAKVIRQELLITLRAADARIFGVSRLQESGLEAIRRGEAYLRGDVIEPRGRRSSRDLAHALYVARPVYYPDDFATYVQSDGTSVVIAWLVPIMAREADFVRAHGWSEFENLLVQRDPDLLDLHRRSIV